MSAYLEAVKEYNDARRHHLTIESYDWDKLRPAVVEWIITIPPYMQRSGDITGALNTLNVLIETAYVMGYERGQSE